MTTGAMPALKSTYCYHTSATLLFITKWGWGDDWKSWSIFSGHPQAAI